MNLTILLDMAADGFGDRVVVGTREAGITAGQLQQLSYGGAAVLRSQGADAVVFLAVNGPAFPVAMFAAARAGVPLIPMNYRLGTDQLDELLAHHPGALGIAEGDQALALARAGIATLTPEQWLLAAAAPAEAVEPDDATAAVLIYTSGTTSTPKCVVLRHSNLVSYVLASVEFAGADDDQAALMSVPPYHIAAVANAITNLFAGRRCLTLENFAPAEWLDLVRTEGITNALVVPTMLARIMQDERGDRSVPTLRTLAYGGARMPVQIIEQALDTWPHVDFVNAYGLTETSSTVAVLGPEDHRAARAADDPAVRARLSSAGKVVPAIEMEIRDPAGEVLPAGTTGRIWVSGEQVSGEYVGSAPAVDARGFFDTRDEGYLDQDGYLFIGGRTDDTIIRGGENIAPAEIEDALLRHAAVIDAVVIGVPDDEWGQRLEAVVVAAPGVDLDPEELRTHVRGLLRSSKTPERIVVWSDLPRTETGKLVRRHVLDRLLSDH